MVEETVTMEGHLIDSDILRKAFARIVEGGGEFEVLEFKVGKTNDDPSFLRLSDQAPRPRTRWTASWRTSATWGRRRRGRPAAARQEAAAKALVQNARFAPAEADGILPDEFYSTTNFDTFVRVDGKWVAARRPEDGLRARAARRRAHLRQAGPGEGGGACRPARGRASACRPPERSRDYSVFGFMSNDVSAEINKGIVIAGSAREMRRTREAGEKIVVVAGPAIVHSGGDVALARLVRDGWVDVLLTGNAFATHDLEKAILKTSLGVCQMSGRAVEGGSRHHLWTINAVNRAGGIRAAVESGLVALGRDVRGGQEGHPVRPGRLHPRRRAAQGRHHRHPGRAEGLRRGAARARACA